MPQRESVRNSIQHPELNAMLFTVTYNSILQKGEIGNIHKLRGIKTKLCKYLYQNKLEQERKIAICPLSSDGYAKGFFLYFATTKPVFGTDESFYQEKKNVEVKAIQDYLQTNIPANVDMQLSRFDFGQIGLFVEIKTVFVSREDVLSNEEYHSLSSKHLSEEEKMDQLSQPRRFFDQNLRKTHSDSDSSKQLTVKKAQKPVRQKHEELLVKTTKLSEKKNDAQDITKLRMINLGLLADIEERDLQLQEASKKYEVMETTLQMEKEEMETTLQMEKEEMETKLQMERKEMETKLQMERKEMEKKLQMERKGMEKKLQKIEMEKKEMEKQIQELKTNAKQYRSTILDLKQQLERVTLI